jgi:hypothetical protein
MRLAYAARDRADMHVAKKDVPTVQAFGISTAGKVRHVQLKRCRAHPANYQSVVGWCAATPQRVVGC